MMHLLKHNASSNNVDDANKNRRPRLP